MFGQNKYGEDWKQNSTWKIRIFEAQSHAWYGKEHVNAIARVFPFFPLHTNPFVSRFWLYICVKKVFLKGEG